MNLKISDLNSRISIENLNQDNLDNNLDEEGYPKDKWRPYYSCRAKVNNLYGKEFWRAKTVNAGTTKEFTIRYCKKLRDINTKNFRIVFEGKEFNIIPPLDDILHKHEWVKLKGIEVV